jgi:Fe-S-cluster-containing dehydrogenase component
LAEEKLPVIAACERCRGCQICQLICSFRHDQAFNPSRAAVQVRRLGGETEFGVTFTPECDRCGTCVSYCLYGALSRLEAGEQAGKGAGGHET